MGGVVVGDEDGGGTQVGDPLRIVGIVPVPLLQYAQDGRKKELGRTF